MNEEPIASTWPLDRYLDHDGYITADSVRALIADACPEMARALRAMVITVSEPDPYDLTSEELEEWIQQQFGDMLADAAAAVADTMPGNSHPTFRDCGTQQAGQAHRARAEASRVRGARTTSASLLTPRDRELAA